MTGSTWRGGFVELPEGFDVVLVEHGENGAVAWCQEYPGIIAGHEDQEVAIRTAYRLLDDFRARRATPKGRKE